MIRSITGHDLSAAVSQVGSRHPWLLEAPLRLGLRRPLELRRRQAGGATLSVARAFRSTPLLASSALDHPFGWERLAIKTPW
jgi:hypothetical protein